MNISKLLSGGALLVAAGFCCLLPFSRVKAAGGEDGKVPVIIENGFKAWAKNRNASWAFDVWKIGGLMERDNKPSALSRYFSQMDQVLGNYESYEVVETKHISKNSEVIYLSFNFAHAAMFGRLMLYQTDSDWVVQSMDFSPKPEAMMPWLMFAGENYAQ